MVAHEDPNPPIKRGRGLSLSTQTPSADEPPAAAPPADVATPITRGRGLQLTTQAGGDPETTHTAQVQLPSGTINYRTRGSGPPLLLLHGYGASGRIWHGVMAALKHQRTCYAPDMPGFGSSTPLAATPTLHALAAEILAFADALGLERFDLLGHALGAAVAATIAGHHPERVGRLALTSLGVQAFAPQMNTLSATRMPFDFAFGFTRPVFDLWRPWTSWAMATPATSLFLGMQILARPPVDVQLWQEYLADHANADARAYITFISAQADPELRASLSSIKAPTMFIVGREDRIARASDAAAAQGLIAGARLQVIDGCGHMPTVERPAEYYAILRSFFNK